MKTLLFLCLGAFGVTLYSSLSTENKQLLSSEKKKYKNQLTWKDLNDITYSDVFVKELDAWFWQPAFSEKLSALNGDSVHIAGFFQNGGTKKKPLYILSHYKELHFGCCSSTGPDDMIDLGSDFDSRKLDVQDSILIKGKLILNADDVYSLNYQLDGAEVVELY